MEGERKGRLTSLGGRVCEQGCCVTRYIVRALSSLWGGDGMTPAVINVIRVRKGCASAEGMGLEGLTLILRR